jgi:prepilin-type N-terminal cleavage/methylation domain-containing protein
MKLNSAKSNRGTQGAKGFTLIEMIGVLAVIAILAAVLIPKVFEAINNARVNNAAMSCNTVKTGIADHYAKYGSLLSSNGIVILTTDTAAKVFDQTLVQEGFLDKPFDVKISSIDTANNVTNHVEVVAAVNAATAPAAGNAAYALSGTAGANDAVGSAVVQAVIPGVTANDAKDLNDRIDGAALGTALNSADMLGRVKFAAPSGGITTVYVYLTHR